MEFFLVQITLVNFLGTTRQKKTWQKKTLHFFHAFFGNQFLQLLRGLAATLFFFNLTAMAPAHSSLKRPAAATSPARRVQVKTEPPSAGKAPDAKTGLPEGTKGPEATAPSTPVAPDAGQSLPARGTGAKPLPKIPQKEAKLMSQRLKALKEKGKPELKEQYSLCKTQQEKRDFFYNVYMLDPEVSSKKVRKQDSDKQKEQVSTMEGWWTKEQIAKDKGILPHMDNYKALTDASVAGLQERPHEDEQLAKLGVMQYEYTFVEKKTKHSREQELQLQEHVDDVGIEDFNAMRLALSGGPKQKTISSKAGKEVADPSVQSECSGIDMVKEVLSQVAGFDDMVKGYQQYCDQAQKKLQKLWKDTMPELVAFPSKAEKLAEGDLESKAEELQALAQKILQGHKDIKKQLTVIKTWATNPK